MIELRCSTCGKIVASLPNGSNVSSDAVIICHKCRDAEKYRNLDISDFRRKIIIPDGWKLVPIEDTDEMCYSGFVAWKLSSTTGTYVSDCYKAMLAAAPKFEGNET